MSTWYSGPQLSSSTRTVTSPQSQEGVKAKRTSLDADMRDAKVWESLRSPIQHCNDCGAPMNALCVCDQSTEEEPAKFGYNTEVTDKLRERNNRKKQAQHTDHWMKVLKHSQEVLSLPPHERHARILKAPTALRQDIAQATNTEW